MKEMVIRIKNLRLRTIIGINPDERAKQQDIVINARFAFDGTRAATSDRVEDSLDYKAIKLALIDHVESSACRLLEKLVSDLVDIIMARTPVLWAAVEIDKPHALRFADSVSVELRRDRDS